MTTRNSLREQSHVEKVVLTSLRAYFRLVVRIYRWAMRTIGAKE
jgi:hypothetical protein